MAYQTSLYLSKRHKQFIQKKAISLTKYVKLKLDEDMLKDAKYGRKAYIPSIACQCVPEKVSQYSNMSRQQWSLKRKGERKK